MIAIELNGVGKRYGSHWVLNRIDCQIRPGESIALFGGNGSGKSTLLKIVATLLTPSTGKVQTFGFNPKNKREIRRRIRFLPHEKQLYGALSVLENLQLAAGIRGVKHPRQQIESALERMRIREMQHRPVAHLSEGLKKRVMIAKLLIGESELVLLDEPYPTLDQEGKEIMTELIRDWKQRGSTILMASHDHEPTLAQANRLLVLEAGKITHDGPPRRV